MRTPLIIGIDTSNYTTSVSVITVEGRLLANIKRLLTVKEGEHGLRQSEAVFAHTVNLPELMRKAREVIADNPVVAVGVSDRPRSCEGSYMPCFLVGASVAEGIGAAASIPVYRFSHQCGHIMAALYSCGNPDLIDSDFAAFHVSGGTTELVRVHPDKTGFVTEQVGGSRDLHAGQVIDRIGVMMGLPFPSGKYMEELALLNTKKLPKKKISSVGTEVNLSGLENLAAKLFKESGDASLTSAFVFDYIGRAIAEMSRAYEDEYGKGPFVYAGGVMCNSIIRNMLSAEFDSYFADASMSSDNAVGIAALALRAIKEN